MKISRNMFMKLMAGLLALPALAKNCKAGAVW
jgi:hypothetical protein